jgi:hypothetical protein
MLKNKKRLVMAGLLLLVIAVAGVFGWRYLPIYKLMKRPTSENLPFVKDNRDREEPPYSIYYDFEIDSTVETPGDLYKGIAYSGLYSTKTFGKNTFSVSIEKRVGDLGMNKIDGVGISAWVYLMPGKNEPNGSLVFTVTNTVGVNTCWKGVSFSGPLTPREKWTKISDYFDLSGVQLRPDDKIQVYFWNNSSTDILTDDIYVVFGKSAERRGDSARVDMTKGVPFKQGFNTPPFPFIYLQKDDIGNNNSVYLIEDGTKKEGDITPGDQVFAGNFTAGSAGLETMLVIKQNGTPEVYRYCPVAQRFSGVPVDCPAGITQMLQGAEILHGSFLRGTDQVLAIGEKSLSLIGIDGTFNPCAKGNAALKVKEIWTSASVAIGGTNIVKGSAVVCDLNGDGISELFVPGKGGSWALFRFDGNGWTTMAQEDENKIKAWDPALSDFKIFAGKFSEKVNGDVLLTVFTDKLTKKLNYSMVKYAAGEKKFQPVFTACTGNIGRILGPDTLLPGDRFFTGHFMGAPGIQVLRYSREWRYDLKQIRFNDSTFQVLANVDFKGFDLDHNPKYFEILKLVPGRWISPTQASILVIARNCKEKNYRGTECREYENLPYLPNTLQIYSFQPK